MHHEYTIRIELFHAAQIFVHPHEERVGFVCFRGDGEQSGRLFDDEQFIVFINHADLGIFQTSCGRRGWNAARKHLVADGQRMIELPNRRPVHRDGAVFQQILGGFSLQSERADQIRQQRPLGFNSCSPENVQWIFPVSLVMTHNNRQATGG